MPLPVSFLLPPTISLWPRPARLCHALSFRGTIRFKWGQWLWKHPVWMPIRLELNHWQWRNLSCLACQTQVGLSKSATSWILHLISFQRQTSTWPSSVQVSSSTCRLSLAQCASSSAILTTSWASECERLWKLTSNQSSALLPARQVLDHTHVNSSAYWRWQAVWLLNLENELHRELAAIRTWHLARRHHRSSGLADDRYSQKHVALWLWAHSCCNARRVPLWPSWIVHISMDLQSTQQVFRYARESRLWTSESFCWASSLSSLALFNPRTDRVWGLSHSHLACPG